MSLKQGDCVAVGCDCVSTMIQAERLSVDTEAKELVMENIRRLERKRVHEDDDQGKKRSKTTNFKF